MYAGYEEDFGLINHAMEIYDRASKELAKENQFEVFNLYKSKAPEFYGVSRTR
jgi:pre-mRNA-splicing factor SYF1